jgi:hypothetical protein
MNGAGIETGPERPMRRIRITKTSRPRRHQLDALPLDPRDPDILRAKMLEAHRRDTKDR